MAFRDWIVDYTYRAKAGITLRRKVPKHYQGFTKEGRVPVILLPGISLKWQFLRNLGDKISKQGHPVYIVSALGRNYHSVNKSAALVHDAIKQHNLTNAVIVGHSKGGLIGKQLLVQHNTDKRVRAVIAIASPFSGTRLARAVPHKSFKEMHTSSDSIQNLYEQLHVNQFIYSIIPAFDNHVWHEKGSELDGAQNLFVKVRGHHKVVFDKVVQEKIIQILDDLSGGKT
jgi:triacylglycerol lipase